jgi:tetrapyrrole methylase family protein/MazG family protein
LPATKKKSDALLFKANKTATVRIPAILICGLAIANPLLDSFRKATILNKTLWQKESKPMKKYTFEDLKSIMDTLLGENGCPWDKAQTHESISGGLIEECYEAVDAIKSQNNEALCEELGDVCLHVVFHGKLAEKDGAFTVDDIIQGISEKMLRRHSHVFGEIKADNMEESLLNWENEKQKEKAYTSDKDKLRKVPKSFPALLRAQKVAGITSRIEEKKNPSKSADIPNHYEEFKNVFSNFLDAVRLNNTADEALIGELLFEISNVSRKLNLNAEIALTNHIETYINNFV